MIAIKDFDMPSCCTKCIVRYECKVADEWDNFVWNGNERCEGCPLVEIEERKVGKWIIDDEEHGRIWHCHCPNCKKDPQDYIGGTENWWLIKLPNFCPNCGAEMRGK